MALLFPIVSAGAIRLRGLEVTVKRKRGLLGRTWHVVSSVRREPMRESRGADEWGVGLAG